MSSDVIATPTLTPELRASPPARRRASRIALWALQIALAIALGVAGASKLAGAPEMVQLFDAVGVGQWVRYVTGVLELLGSLLLLVPKLAGFGALLLTSVMAGAALSQLLVLDSSPAVPLGLAAGLTVVVYARRVQLTALLARVSG